MTYYLLKPCRTATAFISTLKKPQRFPLEQAARRLKSSGLTVTDLKVMLVVAADPDGKVSVSGEGLGAMDHEAAAQGAVDRAPGRLSLPPPAEGSPPAYVPSSRH